MNLHFERSSPSRNSSDVVALFVFQDTGLFAKQIRSIERTTGVVVPAAKVGDFKGKENETALVYDQRGSHVKRYVIVGLGEKNLVSPERYRRAGAAAAKQARSLKARTLAIFPPAPVNQPERVFSAIAEGAYLAVYQYEKYVSKTSEDSDDLHSITLCSETATDVKRGERIAKQVAIICEATYLARDLGNAPANELFPETLAHAAVQSAERYGFSAEILDERAIRDLGMGGVLGVSQGSAHPPRFIILEYGDLHKRPIVLVGKGVTFDTGGISIKPAAGMAEMKMDMSGGAAVLGSIQAAAQLKLPVHVVGLIPAVENMPGANSIHPGDILRHYNGKTSEVDNTDAEGRLILADALAYAEKFKPAAVLDLATLTGACVVALGHFATGMLGNDDVLMRKVRDAGEATYERVWQLPLYDEYEKLIKSDVADVKNVGGRWAGAITAAWFLKKFIGQYNWVHLDIAGTAILEEHGSYASKGASGVGVRLLTEFLRRWK